MKLKYAAIIPVALILLSACSAQSLIMRPLTTPVQPAADAATVMFLRPSSRPLNAVATVIDETGTVLGEAEPGTYFAVRMAPGQHTFYAWLHDGEGMVQAQLLPGRVYRVFLRVYGYGNFGVSPETLHPDREEWVNLPRWMGEMRAIERNPAIQSEISEEDIQGRVHESQEAWQGYTAEQRANRTILPEHGAAQ